MRILMTDTVNMTDSKLMTNDIIIIIIIIIIKITALSFLKSDCHCNLNASSQVITLRTQALQAFYPTSSHGLAS